MANAIPLWINGGSITRVDNTADTLLVNSLDVESADGTTLTLGGGNAVTAIVLGGGTALANGVDIDGLNITDNLLDTAAAGALSIGTTNATTITMDGSSTITIGGSTATSVQVDDLTVTGVAVDGTGTIQIGPSTASAVQVDNVLITGSTIDLASGTTLTIGGAGATATDIQIGTSGQTTTILGDLLVSGSQTTTETATFNGDTNIGNASTDTLTITASIDSALNFSSTQSLTTTTGDIKIAPEGTTIAQGGLGVALTFTNYTTSGTGLTGTGTAFDTELQVGDAIEVDLDGAGAIDVRRVTVIGSATSLTVNAAFTSDVGPVTHGLKKDDNLFEVYTGNADARFTIGKNGSTTITRGEADGATLTLANEEDSASAQVFITPDEPPTVAGANGDIAMTTTSGLFYYYGGAQWNQVGTSTPTNLQGAYDASTGTPVQLNATGADLTWRTASTYDIFWQHGAVASSYYLATDYDSSQITIGSTAGATDISVIIPTDVLDVDAADMDFDGSTFNVGAAGALPVVFGATTYQVDASSTYDINAAGAVTIDSSAAGVAIGAVGASSFDTTTGNLTIATTDASGQLILNANGATAGLLDLNGRTVDIDAGAGGTSIDGTSLTVGGAGAIPITLTGTTVDVDGTGVVSINSSGAAINVGNDDIDQAINVGTAGERTVTIGNVVGAMGVAVNSGTGGIALASTGTGDITIDSDATLLLDSVGVLELNASAGAINIGNDADAYAINVGIGAAARTITVGNATGATALDFNAGTGGVTVDAISSAIALTTTTSGAITANSAGAVDIDGAGAVSINSSGAAINIGNDADAYAINVGTGAAARSITVGNTTTTTAVNVTSGATGDITFAARGSAGNSLTYNDVTNQDITGGTYIGATTSIVSALLALDAAVSGAGDTILNLAPGAAVTQYAGVYMAADGKVEMTDSDAAGTAKFIGIALDQATGEDTPATIRVQLAGETSALGTLTTLGAYAYMSATTGELTMTAPSSGTVLKVGVVSASGKVILQVGTPVTL